MMTSCALVHAGQARKISADDQRKIETKLKDKVAKAVETVAKS